MPKTRPAKGSDTPAQTKKYGVYTEDCCEFYIAETKTPSALKNERRRGEEKKNKKNPTHLYAF